jgi:hypothetical protein
VEAERPARRSVPAERSTVAGLPVRSACPVRAECSRKAECPAWCRCSVPAACSTSPDLAMGLAEVRRTGHRSRTRSRDGERAPRPWTGVWGGPSARWPTRRRGGRRGTGSGRRCLRSCSGPQGYWLDREGGLSRIARSTPRTLACLQVRASLHEVDDAGWVIWAGRRDQGHKTRVPALAYKNKSSYDRFRS